MNRESKCSLWHGRLHNRVWSDYDFRLWTKIAVNRALILPTLLYGSESWTWCSEHLKRLNQFHLTCLCKICRMSWEDKVTNTAVFEKCGIGGIEALPYQVTTPLVGDTKCEWRTMGYPKPSSKESLKTCSRSSLVLRRVRFPPTTGKDEVPRANIRWRCLHLSGLSTPLLLTSWSV